MAESTQRIVGSEDDPDATIITDPNHIRYLNAVSATGAASETRALLDVHTGTASAELNFRVDEGIRQLLRTRLIIVTACLIVVMIMVAVMMALDIGLMPGSIGMRALAIILLVGIMAFLQFSDHVSMVMLRRIELLIVAVPLIEMVLLQTFRTEMQLTLGETEAIPSIRATVGLAACVLVAMYGIFIPSTWQRTALVTGCVALLPSLAAWIQLQRIEQLGLEDPAFNLAIPTLTISMAVVATLGSHLVASLRREVEAARQYGQYLLTEEIGRGGMGVVYRGEHHLLKRPAAIKLIHPESAADEAAVARFEHEVQLSATLTHWNTVRIYDYGRTDHGDFYCVMELLEGLTLSDLLRNRGTLSLSETIEIAVQLCDGLQEAHGKGMVHRDLKPANVFLAETAGRDQVVKILDFGVATSKSSADIPGGVKLIGTPFYMSPEQIRGESTDQTSDIYALGCLIFECVAGSPPFREKKVRDILDGHLQREPPIDDLPESPDGLRTLVARCLEKEPSKRFSAVSEVREACRRLEVELDSEPQTTVTLDG